MTETLAPLYVVPTPLGNMGDISERAREVLTRADWVAAEDTRHTRPLLRLLGSHARLFSADEHHEEKAANEVLSRLLNGESVALVTDAGTPAISDPGARIVARAREAGARVIPLPGPCAATTALCAAGMEESRWLFYGFLPPAQTARQKELESLRFSPYALIFYEAPHRILETVDDLAKAFETGRTLFIARELTKIFESLHACPLAQAKDWLLADPYRQKGEFVLIVSGAKKTGKEAKDYEAERVLRLLLNDGLPVKQAAHLASKISGGAKNTLYQRALEWKKEE